MLGLVKFDIECFSLKKNIFHANEIYGTKVQQYLKDKSNTTDLQQSQIQISY